MKKRLLILEDGSVYEGIAFGGDTYQMGELIFQTGMSGYQEIISDLSYYCLLYTSAFPCDCLQPTDYPKYGKGSLSHAVPCHSGLQLFFAVERCSRMGL